jgi:SAM-dependent methyltransferase
MTREISPSPHGMNFSSFYSKLFPIYETELEKAIGDSKTVLDVGCGSNSPLVRIPKRFSSVGVDIFKPSIDESKKKKIHDRYIITDILKIDQFFKPDSFDCVIASDVIEHLSKNDGKKLLLLMETIAKKKVIIFTPNGYIDQDEYGENPWQRHKSGWSPEEMSKFGYTVHGIHGWKFLRGEHSAILYKPKKIWTFVSDITQLVVRYFPKYAFALLCVKNK